MSSGSCVLAVTFLLTALGTLLGYYDLELFRPAKETGSGKAESLVTV